MNIANWLHSRALQTPGLPALFSGSRCVASYGMFAAHAARMAALYRDGYKLLPGDRLALYMANRIEYLVAMYAAWWLGAVVVPINYKLHPKEAAWIVGNAGAKVLLTDDGKQLNADLLPPNCSEAGINDLMRTVVADVCDFSIPVSLESSALAWLFYTSGTTGRPKGVMLTHENLTAMSMCYLCDVDSIGVGDAWLYAAPMSHGAGLYNFPFVRAGGRHIAPDSRGFDSSEIFSLAEELGSLSLFAAPTMVKRMVRATAVRPAGLRTIVYGGSPMYTADLMEALDTLGPCLAQIYGQGESPMTITAMRRELVADSRGINWENRIASVGTAQACMEVRVVDDAMRNLPFGECGEVITRGPAVMAGYWNNESATRETLVDGWLRTGDIGYLDKDGFLTLTDRSKDVIISGGTNIYPREVEETLAGHPDISEVAVIGTPNDEWGEEVVAFVVLRSGHTLGTEALDQWCRQEIASFKKPRRYIFSEELPKNSYGKVLKTELRLLARQDQSND